MSEPTVAELLALSRAAHQRYRSFQPVSQHGRVVGGDRTLARHALAEARRYRLAADAADPQQTDPAWAAQPAAFADHKELVHFYQQVLGDA